MFEETTSWVIPTRWGWLFLRREDSVPGLYVRFQLTLSDDSRSVLTYHVNHIVLVQARSARILQEIVQTQLQRLAQTVYPLFATEGELAYKDLWQGWAL